VKVIRIAAPALLVALWSTNLMLAQSQTQTPPQPEPKSRQAQPSPTGVTPKSKLRKTIPQRTRSIRMTTWRGCRLAVFPLLDRQLRRQAPPPRTGRPLLVLGWPIRRTKLAKPKCTGKLDSWQLATNSLRTKRHFQPCRANWKPNASSKICLSEILHKCIRTNSWSS